MKRYTIGIDVGGTFTDFLLADAQQGAARVHKVLSSPDDPSVAVLAGLAELAEAEGLGTREFIAAIARIVHGTTVTTNAVLTGRVAKTGLLGKGLHAAWSIGFLGKPRKPFMRGKPTNWSHNFAICYVEKDGTFHVEVIEIFNGVCYVQGKKVTG